MASGNISVRYEKGSSVVKMQIVLNLDTPEDANEFVTRVADGFTRIVNSGDDATASLTVGTKTRRRRKKANGR